MSVRLVLYPGGFLHATVEGNFDFETSRELLIEARKLWQTGACEMFLSLHRVVHANACAIGTMALLAEMARGHFHLRIEHCAEEVSSLFGSGLLDRYFPQEMLDGCEQCMLGNGRACDLPAIATGSDRAAIAA